MRASDLLNVRKIAKIFNNKKQPFLVLELSFELFLFEDKRGG